MTAFTPPKRNPSVKTKLIRLSKQLSQSRKKGKP